MAALTTETESPAETVVDRGGVSSLIDHILRIRRITLPLPPTHTSAKHLLNYPEAFSFVFLAKLVGVWSRVCSGLVVWQGHIEAGHT